MNKQLRETLNYYSKALERFVGNTSKSITSLVRMMVLSRLEVANKAKHYSDYKTSKECLILANGPSLKIAFENGDVHWENKDIFVVNMFVCSNEFWKIKPRFYFVIDGAFFSPSNERTKDLSHSLASALNKVDWDIFLSIPSSCINGGFIKELDNDHIHILRWNTTTFNGFKCLSHFMYRHNMAMPRCQTVTNMALVSAINMNYNNIYLYGVDHSWTRDLRVDNNNVVCYGDRHVYATDVQVIKKECSIGHLLNQFSKMFDTHWCIKDYAKSMKVNIWNCTRDSFVDAYPRKYK